MRKSRCCLAWRAPAAPCLASNLGQRALTRSGQPDIYRPQEVPDLFFATRV